MPEDEIVQYIIVNSNLKMSKGKLCAQVGHGAVNGYRRGLLYQWPRKEKKWVTYWINDSYTKIVVKANGDWMGLFLDREDNHFLAVWDEGRTEIPEDSLTVIASIPMPKSEFPKEVRELKLL